MVVDQRLLKSQMMKYNIGSNVLNKLSEVQQKTQPTNTSVATATDTPIAQIQQIPQAQQTRPIDTYKVITNKFSTYDIKDLMGFGPQAVKNQLGFMQSVNNYNRLQAQADANTDPNVRYNLTKPELTNKQTLQIQQATPETNEQGLKINKTNSFKDLVIDLQNVANQGRNLEFMKFRELYPEYVENWDRVVDLFESIKANPQYSAEKVTTTAQKVYPELFGINENYSDKDKTVALQRLYDEMVSNKQNGIQLTQQDIIDRYPEYANTEDINTVMEVQNLMNRDRKNTPTFNDIYENFESLIKGDVAIGNTEKKTMKDDISKIENMSQSTYGHLSEEGKKYVQYLATAKQIADYVKEQYYTTASDVEIVENLKNKDPELYNEIFGDLDIQANLSEEDRKLLDEGYTIGAGKSRWTETKHSATEKLAGLGRKLQSWAGTEWKGERNPQPVNGQREDGTYERNPLMREDGTLETDPIKIREIKMAGNNYQQRVRMQEYRGKNPGMDKLDFKLGELLFGLGEEMQRVGEKGMEKIESSQSWKDVAELNKTSFWDALKKGDVKTMLSKSTAALGQATIDMGLYAINPALSFGSMYAGSYERAMKDIESDESMKGMTQEEKERAARLAAGVESVIEKASMDMWFGGALSKVLPGFNSAILKGIVQTELGAASEGGEEVLQEFFNNLIMRSYGSDREMGTLQDYWDIFTETFFSSHLMSAIGGTREGIDQAQINQIQNEIKKQGELRNTVLEGQAILSENFNDFAQRVEEVPGTTTEELQQVWNNTQQKKQELEQKANNITSNSYNNVNVPSYERTTVKENEQPKLSAKDSQEYTDLLDEMEKNGEITKEDRKKVEMSLGVFTRNTEKTEQPQTEGLAEVAETPKTEKKTGWWTRKMSGLDNETITRIENNPYISSYWNNAVNMVEKEGLSMDNGKIIEQPMQELGEELLKRIEKAEKDLGEDGRMYRLIKDIKETYDLSDSRKGIEGVLKNYDITTNEDGKLDFSNSQFIKAEDTNAISRAVELLNNTDLTNITPKQYWNLRKKLSSLSGFDKGTSKDGEAVVRQLRHLVDQLAKDNIPGLKKVDEIFSKELKYLEEIKQGLVYQQGERKGQIKDNFYSILKTINNQNKQQMNQRLEKIMPDLSDKVEAINMLPKLLKAYAVKSRLIEVGTRNIGKVGGAVTGGIPGLVVGYVFDEITGKVSKNLRKNAINKIVNNMSDTAKQRLEDIAAKQEEKETLTQKERETLNQVKAEIEKIIEQENNEQKPQTPSETEKKSEKKTDKAEQVQGMAEINQNKKTETKGLGEISNMKQPTLFQKGRGNPITKKQVNQLVKQLKKTGLAKDVKMYETQEDFEKAMEEEDARLQSVWHGSPHQFEKFDSSHMGEGEGAQAHGWGHYVAVDEDTGRYYGNLNGPKYKGKEKYQLADLSGYERNVLSTILDQIADGAEPSKAIESIKKYYQDIIDEENEILKTEKDENEIERAEKEIYRFTNMLEVANNLKTEDFESTKGNRNLYQVEIPDMVKKDTPTGSNYFEEGGEITKQQLEEIYTQLVKEFDKKKEGKSKRVNNLQDGQLRTFREWIDNNNIQVGEDLYSSLSHVLGGDKAASQFLESLGYDGIHYFGGRDGEAYVIFNDDALQITNHIQYLKDTNGDIAGAVTPDETVHLIESNLRGDTATHEFSHLLWSYAKKNNPNLYKALQKIAREAPQELKDYVKKTYGEMTDEAFLDEVFAWKQGKYSGIKTARTWYQRMWDAIKNIWNSIKNSFGSKYANLDVFEAYETMSSEELMDRVDKLLKGGKEIGRGEGATQFEVAGDIYSNNFKNWFGNWENGGKDVSKVVDKAGKPLEVIHETYWDALSEPKGKAVFDKNMSESGGFWFSDIGSTPGYEYGDNKLKVYLKMQNPNIVKSEHFPGRSEIIEAAQKKGYDGAIRKGKRMDGKDYTVYYVNKPNQIKSATDNVGTYDPNNPDIRYEKIGGLSNTQIKKFAVQRGLAEISKGADKEYTVKNGKVGLSSGK